MSELPIRHFLQEEFNYEVNSKQYDPFEAYTYLQEQLKKRRLSYDTYAQATLTSGGHARNPNLSWLEKLTKNVEYAQRTAEHLFASGVLHPHHTIEAATLGLVNHWNEKDYITFWFNVLARPDTVASGLLKTDELRTKYQKHIKDHGIDFSKFNNYDLTNEERYGHYIAYANAAIDAVKEFAYYAVVSRLVAVSEVKGSLGASAERYFTKRLGGIPYNLAVAQLKGTQHLSTGTASAYIVKDTDELVRFGATIFDPRTGERIIMIKDDGDPSLESSSMLPRERL